MPINSSDFDRWLTRLLQPALAGRPIDADDLAFAGGISLLSADTDRTQDFVFQSPRLTEIRGASMTLDELNTKALPDILSRHGLKSLPIPDGCLVYVGGGSLMALVPGDLAPTLVAGIEALYPRRTDSATITAVARPVSPADIGPPAPASSNLNALRSRVGAGGWSRILHAHGRLPGDSLTAADSAAVPLRRLLSNQALALKQRKNAKRTAPLIEAIPYARRCRSCGSRPVAHFLTGLPGEPPRPLCAICFRHAQEGIHGRSDWLRQFTEAKQISVQDVDDLSDIGKAAPDRASGYVGFIYADGDSLGRFLQSAPSLDDYARLSRRISGAMRSAVFDALFDHLAHGSDCRPFEIITIGGDDALLIVPGDVALPVALSISSAFSRALSADGAAAPTMSAGVVIAHDSNPIYFLRDLAHDLCLSAKKGKSNTGQACIDFMVLKSQSAMATNVEAVRAAPSFQVKDRDQQEIARLTGRPYTLAETQQLIDSVRILQDVRLSPGQLHALRRNLRQGRLPGLIYYLYQRTRLRADQRQALARVEAIWGMDMEQQVPPWRLRPPEHPHKVFDTPFLDMLELRDFVY